MPWELLGQASPGMGPGLGSRVMFDPAQIAGPGLSRDRDMRSPTYQAIID